jgi:hypothetical protein
MPEADAGYAATTSRRLVAHYLQPALPVGAIHPVVALVGTAGLVACVLAARRELIIDPAQALRQD